MTTTSNVAPQVAAVNKESDEKVVTINKLRREVDDKNEQSIKEKRQIKQLKEQIKRLETQTTELTAQSVCMGITT